MKRQQISRRQALGGLAALAAVPANANRIWAGSEEPISAGVLTEATGGGHLRQFLQGFASSHGVARVAVSDPTGKKFDQAKAILDDRLEGLYRSHQEMLQKARPKLVVVALEGHHSPPAIRMALEAGSHVITEKPGCARLENFEPLAPLAQTQNRELMLAMHTRMSQAIQKARELIRKGYLGKPYSATMDWIADQTRLTRPEFHSLWVASKAKAGGGKLIYHGIHYLDVLQYLTGDRIDRISALCENVGWTAHRRGGRRRRHVSHARRIGGDAQRRLLSGPLQTESDPALGVQGLDAPGTDLGRALEVVLDPPGRSPGSPTLLLSGRPQPPVQSPDPRRRGLRAPAKPRPP